MSTPIEGDLLTPPPNKGEAAIRVLVADDDETMRSAITRVLRKVGFDVTVVEDGQEAIATLAQRDFDVVVSDILMPHMNGIDLLRHVRARDLDLPVVLVTGGPSVDTAARAVEYGAFRYILKPFDTEELRRVVTNAAQLGRLSRVKREAHVLLGEVPGPTDRAGLELCFSRALESLWMAFQPLVDSERREVVAYEALMRSKEPALPHPGAVLDAAEKLHRIPDVLRAVLPQVAHQMRALPNDALVFVNLHPEDLNDGSLVDDACPLHPLAGRIVLEVTERQTLGSVADLAGVVGQLRRVGFRIAVDDLGAGYASLSSFADLEPDYVKIDMGLVRDIDKSDTRQRVVGAMVRLSHEMGIRVVGEGVETQAERDALVALGCDLLQGYFFAKPGPGFPEARWG